MHRLSFITLAILLSASAALASEGNVVPWTEATFTTIVPAPYGRVQLNLKVEPDGRLIDISLSREGGVPLYVSPVAWANVSQAQVSQARTTFKHSFDGTPWLFLHIPYGEPLYVQGQPEWNVLVVAFRGDRAVYRALNIPRRGGGFDWQPSDLPQG